MPELTVDRVHEAFAVLATGDRGKIVEYWSDAVQFEIPGSHAYAGWYDGLDAFLGFLGAMGQASGGSATNENIAVVIDADAGISVDLNAGTALRADAPAGSASPYDLLDIHGGHILTWKDGKIVEGRGYHLGDGVGASNLWWAPIDAAGHRRDAHPGLRADVSV